MNSIGEERFKEKEKQEEGLQSDVKGLNKGIIMRLLEILGNALKLLLLGEWREFMFRLRVMLGQIDLQFSSQADLNLSVERCYDYADSGGLHLDRILKELNIQSDDSIVDFGSGKGGAMFTCSKFPFKRITGCEISAELVDIAKKNLSIMKVDNIDFVVGDAAEFSELDSYNYFYFFNPFPCSVMDGVIRNIVVSLRRNPRNVTMIYCNPECDKTVTTDTPFQKIKEYQHKSLTYYIYRNN